MKTFMIRSVLGIFFGAFLSIMMTFGVIYFGGNEALDAQLFVSHSLRSIFAGWFFTVTPLIFENEKLSLSKQTALHFGTVVVLYFILAFGTGWIPFSMKNTLSILALFIVTYVIIWTSFYLYFRKEAKILNAELDEL